MVDYKRVLGENMRRERRALGLSQEALALDLGIDRTYVSGLERAKRNPSLEMVARIAKRLGKTPAELLRSREE
jgi:transcriptional regulator with XRE-family HTH domain